MTKAAHPCKVWTYPIVKGKTRLNILCALTPQFYGRGANFFDRRYVWPYKGLIIGTDPVAVDAIWRPSPPGKTDRLFR